MTTKPEQVRTALPIIWNDEFVHSVDQAFREINDLALDPQEMKADPVTGLYLGTVAGMPFYAEQLGLLMWTQDILEVMGEQFARKILGDEIQVKEVTAHSFLLVGENEFLLVGENEFLLTVATQLAPIGRWAYLLNQAAGKVEALNLIAELIDVGIQAQFGNFDKSRSQTDKSQWLFIPQTQPSTVRPHGVDIVLRIRNTNILNAAQIGYINTVIPRYLRYDILDVRITVIYEAATEVRLPTTLWTHTDYGVINHA